MRWALITGAARGIGRAVARRLLVEGYGVFAVDRDREMLARTLAELATDGTIEGEIADLADPAAIDALADRLRRRTDRLAALVNNAGINIRKPLEELAEAEWARVLAVNLTAPFLLVRALARELRAGRGAVVNIASTRAHMSEPHSEAYAASKGGLVALTHALAISLGPEVRVNCISPGWIHTHGPEPDAEDHAWHPAGRVGKPEDVAELVAYLVGPRAGFATGAEFVLDGGTTRKMVYP